MEEKSEVFDVPRLKAKLLAKMGDSVGDYPAQIEQHFPHILARIADRWGTVELDAYLDALMFADREGRKGFPPAVATELFRLSACHGALGLSRKSSATGWASVDDDVLEKKAFANDK